MNVYGHLRSVLSNGCIAQPPGATGADRFYFQLIAATLAHAELTHSSP